MAGNNVADEFIVIRKSVPLIKKHRTWIKNIFDVDVILGNVSDPKESKDKQCQWVTLEGQPNDRSSAKEYIVGLCHPEDEYTMTNLAINNRLCEEPEILDRVRRDTHAVLTHDIQQKTLRISGTELAVTLALSTLEDLTEYDDDDDDRVSVLSEVQSEASLRLETTFERVLTENSDGLSSPQDYANTSDSIKRVMIQCLSDADKTQKIHKLDQAMTKSLVKSDAATSVTSVAMMKPVKLVENFRSLPQNAAISYPGNQATSLNIPSTSHVGALDTFSLDSPVKRGSTTTTSLSDNITPDSDQGTPGRDLDSGDVTMENDFMELDETREDDTSLVFMDIKDDVGMKNVQNDDVATLVPTITDDLPTLTNTSGSNGNVDGHWPLLGTSGETKVGNEPKEYWKTLAKDFSEESPSSSLEEMKKRSANRIGLLDKFLVDRQLQGRGSSVADDAQSQTVVTTSSVATGINSNNNDGGKMETTESATGPTPSVTKHKKRKRSKSGTKHSKNNTKLSAVEVIDLSESLSAETITISDTNSDVCEISDDEETVEMSVWRPDERESFIVKEDKPVKKSPCENVDTGTFVAPTKPSTSGLNNSSNAKDFKSLGNLKLSANNSNKAHGNNGKGGNKNSGKGNSGDTNKNNKRLNTLSDIQITDSPSSKSPRSKKSNNSPSPRSLQANKNDTQSNNRPKSAVDKTKKSPPKNLPNSNNRSQQPIVTTNTPYTIHRNIAKNTGTQSLATRNDQLVAEITSTVASGVSQTSQLTDYRNNQASKYSGTKVQLQPPAGRNTQPNNTAKTTSVFSNRNAGKAGNPNHALPSDFNAARNAEQNLNLIANLNNQTNTNTPTYSRPVDRPAYSQAAANSNPVSQLNPDYAMTAAILQSLADAVTLNQPGPSRQNQPVPSRQNQPGPSSSNMVPGIPVIPPNRSHSQESEYTSLPPEYLAAPATPPSRFQYIVVDGSNVAMAHGKNKIFSCRGIAICVNFFLERGNKNITVFVPQWRSRAPTHASPITDQPLLTKLEEDGFLVFTPARRVDGRTITCYDDKYVLDLAAAKDGIVVSNDNYQWRRQVFNIGGAYYPAWGRYVLDLAAAKDGIVVSNDNYRDLIDEKVEYRRIIKEKQLMFSWVDDIFMPPDDPLGRNGPNLHDFLRKPKPFPARYNPRNAAQPSYQRTPHNPAPLPTSAFNTNVYNRARQQINSSLPRQPNNTSQQRQQQQQNAQLPRLSGSQIFANNTTAQLRSEVETKLLRQTLIGIFPGHEVPIERVLKNHPHESDCNRMINYLMNIIDVAVCT